MSQKLKITLGSDPEFMLFDHDIMRIISSIPVVKHDKHNPIDLGDGIKLYSDNVLLETSFPPSDSPDGAVSTIKRVLTRIHDKLGSRYSLVAKASHMFTEEDLGPKPEVMAGELPVAWEIGCNASYDAYTRAEKVPDPFSSGLRSGSMHIHVGHESILEANAKLDMIKLLDLIVGCSSIIFDHDETSLARRALYGKAGEFRPTPYGVEWRVMGNYALRSPELTKLVFELVEFTVGFAQNAEDVAAAMKFADWNLVRTAINTNNKALAEMALKDWLPREFYPRIHQQYPVSTIAKQWQIA